jgi:hypothetical protein
MVTRTVEEMHTAQEEVMVQAPEIEVSEDVKDKAQVFIDAYRKRLTHATEAFAHRQEAEIEAGEPQLPLGYQYWNCLTVGPIQFFGNPPYRPGKIIAAGEACLLLGVIWINPVNGPGGSLPGTIVLGGRPWRARFEGIDLTSVANGPDFTYAGVFASPAPVVTLLPYWMPTPDPGINPRLYEMNFTADVTLPGQPFAAFSTWHLEPDMEPGFLGLGPVGPQWQFERPARFLIYRK